MSKRLIAVVFFALSHAAAWASTAEFAYTWKSGDLLRYDYLKTVTITQPDDSGKPEERKTEFAGVMILEIRSVANGAASGSLRFDSPRVSLPVLRTFNSQADAPELQ